MMPSRSQRPTPTPLWAPWRMEYIKHGNKSSGCFLCDYIKDKKGKEPIIATSRHSYVVLNIFPYNPGHLMIVPKQHKGNLEELKADEFHDLSDLTRRSVEIIKKALKPEGINIGLNLGKAAGAGVIDHLHYHVVPRWVGDTNFMPIFSETKVISEHLSTTYKSLREAFSKGGF